MAIFTNQATLTYNGNTTNSNIAFGELLETLTAAKNALETTYTPGDTATYVVSLRNTGTAALTGLTATDDLGGYTFAAGTVYPLDLIDGSVRLYINGVAQAAPTVTAGPPLSITGINIPAGGDAVLVYRARVNNFANPAGGGTISNTITFTGAGLTTPATATNTLTASTEPEVTISKSISPSQVTDNSPVTYTFILQNTGNEALTAADNAVITDTFDPILTGLTVTYNATPWTEGVQYTYNDATGLFSTTAGQLTVPAATFTQDAATGAYVLAPGTGTLVVTGTI